MRVEIIRMIWISASQVTEREVRLNRVDNQERTQKNNNYDVDRQSSVQSLSTARQNRRTTCYIVSRPATWNPRRVVLYHTSTSYDLCSHDLAETSVLVF